MATLEISIDLGPERLGSKQYFHFQTEFIYSPGARCTINSLIEKISTDHHKKGYKEGLKDGLEIAKNLIEAQIQQELEKK